MLLEKRHEGPMLVQRPFYPEGEAVCHVYLLHPPGGVVGGDILQLDVRVESSAHTLITMPGATKFYRSAGPQATLGQHFSLDDGARLEWLPQDTILFPGARARTETRFDLHGSARLTGWETLCLGRPVMHEAFDRGELVSRFAVYRDGQPLLHEHLRIQGGHLAKLAGQPLLSTLVFTPADENLLAQARALLQESAASLPLAGATLLGDLLVVRLLGGDNERIQRLQQQLWAALRPAVMGLDPSPPRIWST
ncbi:MAG: urease accessory protein UreD [Lautropia mirabilis]|nr:urease accessory protein UreD [Lautropia mirabilis]